ncbi:hypothetical protein HXX76_003171 [Chlamydomonas incerta]|uniref:BRX domain-containing protein n=1 Tax=Chlamydomonas incerta TaxID=51695 RepID=A0A835W6S8_CHLIN|nr:hypothetical protein HXX76_003171 [Chlamydomonas incerta]|eukprot:KAG2441550.1 hypothetical protein HXX76_003171 [Chlamydomonas incerta]
MELLPPTYEGGGVFVNGFPSGPKPYEEVLTFLRKGTDLLKYGRIGNPKYHPFRLSNDDLELQWESKKGQIRRVPLGWITKWQRGQETSVFKKHPQPKLAHRSFSIFYVDENKRERTLDVICRDPYEFEMWFWGVQIIRYYPPHMMSAPTPLNAHPHSYQGASSVVPVPVNGREASAQPIPPPLEIPSLRSSLADDRPPKPTPKTKPTTGLSVMVGVRNSGGPVPGGPLPGRRGDRRELGDLYVWGSLVTTEEDEWAPTRRPQPPSLNEEAMRYWQNSSVPVLVQNAGSVDVVRVACAPRHAALITRKGELYTWGFGKNGNLGHGWCTNLASPRLVPRMSGKGVRAVACGEGATAAISADMRLYMWGSGGAGQLGTGYAFPVVEPAPVLFPGLREDARVLAVSCGPYHTAAITEGGLLFTWGSGLFGKLGHGGAAAEYRPRRVAALEDKYVTCVSCGYWHTAAVAAARTTTRSQSTPFGTVSTPAALPSPAPLPPSHSAPSVAAAAVGGSRDGPSSIAGFGSGVSVGGGGGGADGASGTHSGRVAARLAQSEMSSSGSDLQAVVAAVNTAAAAGPSSMSGDPSAAGSAAAVASAAGGVASAAGGAGGANGPLLGPMRSDVLSSSVASLEQLRDTPDASSVGPSGSGGHLYTWGGDFSWTEPAEPSKKGAEHAAPKRDHHGGCLGHGDKEGRLLPTRVRGDIDKHGVVQVVCGWSMTVALSRDGRVYQMGGTGAGKSGEKSCPWEGALAPTRVDGNLFGMFVEEVACGMHHVVVVASRVQANGFIPDDQRRVRLLSWGRGSEGQLGIDSGAGGGGGLASMSGEGPLGGRMGPPQLDYSLPQVVTSVDGKRVLHISAGGNHTMAVIEHDPRSRRSHHPSGTPSATPTGHHAYGAAAGGGGAPAYSRLASYGPSHHHPSLAGSAGDARSLRDSHNGGGGSVGAGMQSLLGMASPFQIAQSLPVAAAAAGLQSLGQMVATVGPKSKALAAAALGSAGSGGAGSDGSRNGQGGAGSARTAASSRRHGSTNSRMVAIPAPTAAPYLPSGAVTRSETSSGHNRDMRRATSRLHHHAHAAAALAGQPHFNKSASMNAAHVAKAALETTSAASGGMASHRSSPPLAVGKPGEEVDSRSVSPTSSSLYEISSTAGTDFAAGGAASLHRQASQLSGASGPASAPAGAIAAQALARGGPGGASSHAHPHGHPPLPRTSIAGPRAAGAAGGAAAAAAGAALADGELGGAGVVGGDGPVSARSDTDLEGDSYFQGSGRGLDMVPEQSEESPSSPSGGRTASRLHGGSAAGAGAVPPHLDPGALAAAGVGVGVVGAAAGRYMGESADSDSVGQHTPGGSMLTGDTHASPHPMHPRVAMLARASAGGGGGAGSGGEGGGAGGGSPMHSGLRSSASTMDSSYASGATGSSGASPMAALHTPSPETPDDAISSHPRAPHVGGPYGLPAMATPGAAAGGDESATPLPQQQPPIPYATPPSLGASPLPTPASGRHGTHAGPEPPTMGRMPSLSAGQAGVPQPRGREISMSAWAAPAAVAAAAAAAAAAGGGGGGGMAAGGGAAQPGLYRGEASFRAYGNSGDGVSAPASGVESAASGGGHHRVVVGGGTAGGARRAGGSRGHSRHASYDSADVASGRDAGVDSAMHQRSGSIFELVPPGAYLGGGGGSGTHTPPRLTSVTLASPPRGGGGGGMGAGHVPPAVAEAALANVALKQQNDLLMQQVEALRQQVALLAQAAGMGVAAAAAGGAAQAAAAAASGGLGYPPPLPPGAPSMPIPVAGAVASPVAVAMPVSVGLPSGAAGGNLVVSGESAGVPAFPGPGSNGSNGNPLGAPMLPPPPMHLHHALSSALGGAVAAASAGAVVSAGGGGGAGGAGGVMPYAPPPTPQPPQPPHGVGLPPLSPSGAGRASAGPVMMMGPGGGGGGGGGPPPASMTAAANAAAARHRRSTSVDVSSLIATRDGIGPARDYLPSASQQTAGGAPPSPGGGAAGGSGGMLLGSSSLREMTLGHATAPPALEALRMNHPGMSLAQAALAEADEEGLDEATSEEEEDDDEADETRLRGRDRDSRLLGADADDDSRQDGDSRLLQSRAMTGGAASSTTGRDAGADADVEEETEEDGGGGERASSGGGAGAAHRRRRRRAPGSGGSGAGMGAGGGGDVSVTVPPMSILAAQSSMRRQLYVGLSPQTSSQAAGSRHAGGYGGGAAEAESSAAGGGVHMHGEPFAAGAAASGQRTDVSETSSVSISGGAGGDGYSGSEQGDGGVRPAPLRRRGGPRGALDLHHLGSGGGGGRSGGGVASGEELFGAASGGSMALQQAQQQQQAQALPPDGQMFQYAPGVFITLRPPAGPSGRAELCKLRFSRRHFSQTEAQQWWAAHRAELFESYHVTASVGGSSGTHGPGGGGGGGGSRGTQAAMHGYPASPSGGGLAPPLLPSHSPQAMQPPALALAHAGSVSHTRGFSSDTQGTSASGGAGTGNANLYFSIGPAGAASPGPQGTSGGSAVGGDSMTRSTAAYWAPAAAGAMSGGAGGGAGGGGGGDPYAAWADHTYSVTDDPAMVAAAGMGGMPGPAAGALPPPMGMPPRHHRSRSGSRNASGGAAAAVPPQVLLAQQQAQWAAAVAAGQAPVGLGSGGGAVTVAPFQQHPHPHIQHHHTRSRSGGAASSRSNLSNRS